MNDFITLLATATDPRLDRFASMVGFPLATATRRKQTLVFVGDEARLPHLIDAATASAVTLQRVHEPGRDEWYETLHRGPMEGWASRVRA